jgi:hypothetical protein
MTPTAPSVAGPSLKPMIVTVKAAAEMVAPAIEMTTDVLVGEPQFPVSPNTLLLPADTVGVSDMAKNPEGYVMVNVPPTGMGVVGVKPRVTGTDVFPAIRSDSSM